MKNIDYLALKAQLILDGYEQEINWQRDLQPCTDSEIFRDECIWVILNSGMKEQIARLIWDRIKFAISEDIDISQAFGHKGKVAAIKHVRENHIKLFNGYLNAVHKLEYLQEIPFIGSITKYHLAKNLGHDVIKPDRHLVRIAKQYGVTCEDMCEQISKETGDKVSVVDIVLWRSANLGMV